MNVKKAVQVPKDILGEFQQHLYEREAAKETIRKYCYDVDVFLRYLSSRMLTKEELLQYKNRLAENYAVSSANSMLAALNQFLEYIGLGCWKLKRLRVQQQVFMHQSREMTEAEYQRLIKTAQEQGRAQLALIMETMAGTGARVGELSFFTVEQIRRGYIEICHKGKCRSILIPQCLKMKLLVYAGKMGIHKGLIFITKGGRPKDRSNIWAEMKSVGEKAGIRPEKIFPHNMRHLFARCYYRMTKDLAGLASLLGHSSLEVTRIYTADCIQSYQNSIDRLGIEVQKNTT